ncbi:MAG: exonuclease domain-containing protein [Culicoidibacterales bacterium]
MSTFIAIDFETANHYRNSACALGLTKVVDGIVVESRAWLIRPFHIAFSEKNIAIHRIRPEMVRNEPNFAELAPEIIPYFENCDFVLAHNAPFDFGVLSAVLQTYDLPNPTFIYSCTVQMAKKAWPQLPSHKLNDLAYFLGLPLNHHDAQDDARVCAQIALAIFAEFQFTSIQDFDAYFQTTYTKSFATIIPKKKQSQLRIIQPQTTTFDEQHPFFHKKIVFSGRFHQLSRAQAIQKIANIGAIHQRDISLYTDILVISQKSYEKWIETQKTSRKLEYAMQHNHSQTKKITVITERKFLQVLEHRKTPL